MSIKFACLQCGRRLSAASDKVGKTVPCPGCKTYLTIPSAESGSIPVGWIALAGVLVGLPLLLLGTAVVAVLLYTTQTADAVPEPEPETTTVAQVRDSADARTQTQQPRVVPFVPVPEPAPAPPGPKDVDSKPTPPPDTPVVSEPPTPSEEKPAPPEEVPPGPAIVFQPPAQAPAGAERAKLLDGIRYSAIAAVIEANNGRVPASGEELAGVFARLGQPVQLPVSFSSVALDSGLANPRVVFAPGSKDEVGGMGFGGGLPSFGGSVGGGGWSLATAEGAGRQTSSVSKAAVNAPDFTGRLFLAANMEKSANGKPRVRSVEFISWNSQSKRFDFGLIENMGGFGRSELHVVDGVKCFSCHKTRGPILGGGPWSNTTHNSLVRTAASQVLNPAREGDAPAPAGRPFGGGFFGPGGVNLSGPSSARFDGVDVLSAQALKVDEHVRLGAERLRNREAFRLMTRSANGPKALVALLNGLVTPNASTPTTPDPRKPVRRPGRLGGLGGHGLAVQHDAIPLPVIDKALKTRIDQTFANSNFNLHWQGYQKTTASSVLADFSPAGPPPTRPGLEWGGDPEKIKKYDEAREKIPVVLPSQRVPSSPKAFQKAPIGPPLRASSIVSVERLAETIGTSEGDRDFLARTLLAAEARVARPRVTATALATAVFEGPTFADVLQEGSLPDRDEFKDRFLTGLKEVLATKYDVADAVAFERKEYASIPEFKPGAEVPEAVLVPTTACLRCHEVRPSGKGKATEPLPSLAFDPFDQNAREAWVRSANPQRKEQVLSRMLKRLVEDKDMPPEDEPEHEKFRVGNPASFDAVQAFLESELNKLKRD